MTPEPSPVRVDVTRAATDLIEWLARSGGRSSLDTPLKLSDREANVALRYMEECESAPLAIGVLRMACCSALRTRSPRKDQMAAEMADQVLHSRSAGHGRARPLAQVCARLVSLRRPDKAPSELLALLEPGLARIHNGAGWRQDPAEIAVAQLLRRGKGLRAPRPRCCVRSLAGAAAIGGAWQVRALGVSGASRSSRLSVVGKSLEDRA